MNPQMPMTTHCGQDMERIDNYLRCVVCKNTSCWDMNNGINWCFRHNRAMTAGRSLNLVCWGCSACDCDRYVGMSSGVCISFPDKKKWWQFWKLNRS